MRSTRDAYGEVLLGIGKTNPNVVVLDADVSKATRTVRFAKEYPGRFFNVGCAEANLIGTAAGFSLAGKIPLVSTFAVFASCRALDQVRNTVAYPSLNVKIVATHGGITVGADGASHQSIEDIAIMRSIPHMTVIVPCDSIETKKVVRAVVQYPGPVYIRLGRAPVPDATSEDSPFTIGKGLILREGNDVGIFACGIMVSMALEAASELSQKGIFAKVINIHTIKPLDKEVIITTAKETGAIVTAEEHNVLGGLGGAVAEVVGESVPIPVVRVGLEDTFAESGEPDELLEKYELTKESILTAVHKVLRKKRNK